MTQEILTVYVIFFLVAFLFVTEHIRSDIVAVMCLLALTLSGVLTLPEALSGFSDPVIMIIIAMSLVGAALVNTGIAQRLGEFVMKTGGGSETRLIILLMLTIAFSGAFMNSTAIVAIFLPITLSISEKTGINPKRLLMPVSMGGLISGMMTLVSTAPNLVIDDALKARGLESFAFFSFTPFGIVIIIVATIYMLVFGRRLLSKEGRSLPDRHERSIQDLAAGYGLAEKAVSLSVPADSPLVNQSVGGAEIKSRFGFLIIGFGKRRSGKIIFSHASPGAVFEAGDEFFGLGSEEGIARLIEEYKLKRVPLGYEQKRHKLLQEVGVAEIMLAPESDLIGRSIGEIDIYGEYSVYIGAVKRRGEVATEAIGETKLDFGDVLLVFSGWQNILKLREKRNDFIVLGLPREVRDIAPGRKHAPLAIGIIAAMVFAIVLTPFSPAVITMIAALALIISGCIRLDSIYQTISWQSVVLIAGIMPLATALDKSGASHLISVRLVNALGYLGPTFMEALIFLVAAVIGFFISNTATAILIAPIAIDIALAVGASPQAFAMTVAIACSAAYVTPVSSPGNLLVQEPGGYSFMDYVKVGLPLLFLTLVSTVILIRLLYVY